MDIRGTLGAWGSSAYKLAEDASNAVISRGKGAAQYVRAKTEPYTRPVEQRVHAGYITAKDGYNRAVQLVNNNPRAAAATGVALAAIALTAGAHYTGFIGTASTLAE